jgi:hypothetical protein
MSKQSIMCPCGGTYSSNYKNVHMKTKKHITYENNKINDNNKTLQDIIKKPICMKIHFDTSSSDFDNN